MSDTSTTIMVVLSVVTLAIVLGLMIVGVLNAYRPSKVDTTSVSSSNPVVEDRSADVSSDVSDEDESSSDRFDPPPEVVNSILVSKAKWARAFRAQMAGIPRGETIERDGELRVTHEVNGQRKIDKYPIDIWVLNKVSRQRPLLVIHALNHILGQEVVQFSISIAKPTTKERYTAKQRRRRDVEVRH